MKNPRPKNLEDCYGWCSKPNHGIFFHKKEGCYKCKEEKQRKKANLCCAILAHGPGHQSKTYCDQEGKHTIHTCRYGSYDQIATWKGPITKIKCTGYFDDPPIEKGLI